MDLRVLCESGFTNTFAGQGVLLQSSCEWVLACTGMLLLQELAAGQTSTSNCMVESLWLWLRRWRSSEGGLRFGGGCRRGKEVDFLADGPAQVTEGLRFGQLDDCKIELNVLPP